MTFCIRWKRDVFPDLGSAPIKNITAGNVISVLRKIENRSAAETSRRIRQRMSAVFVYAIASGRAENDPAAAVQKAMRPVKKGRQPAITNLEQAREILRHADATPASPVTKLALRLLALTALRPGTLITAPWVELGDLDTETPIWQVPAARMKLRLQYKDDHERDHLVALSTQAIDVTDPGLGGGGLLEMDSTMVHVRSHLVVVEAAAWHLTALSFEE